jgi:hypothetical protein
VAKSGSVPNFREIGVCPRFFGTFAQVLDPASYIASQELAARLLDGGSMGVIFPSVRRAGGTNLACFRPALVGNVRKRGAYRLTWEDSPAPVVEPI